MGSASSFEVFRGFSSQVEERVLLVRLPCNPIFPIGPIYLADHLHKCFPDLPQRILDLAALPVLDVERVLLATIDQFRPTLLVFSWRDIQIYAPVDGRTGNPLQHSFEVFYASNPLRRLRGAFGGLLLMKSHYGELWRNQRLLRHGLRAARRYVSHARAVLGGGAVSVFYEQLGRSLPKGTIVSVGEGELLLENLLRGVSLNDQRCFVVGEPVRAGLIHEQPESRPKTACDYDYISSIWPQLNWYLEGGDFYVGVQTKRGCPHNCCYCVYTVVEGKQVRLNPVKEVVAEMRQLYDRGVRGFWFTDAQFIPARRYIEDAKNLLTAIQAEGLNGIRWAAYIRADNLDAELAELMVATGMSYFEIGITSGSQELVRKMRMGYNLRTVLENCRLLVRAGFRQHVSVNYSFNVIDERPETIRQSIAYHRELERIFGPDKVEPAIFFIGLQPHTHLEQYGFEQGLLQPGYNPMSMMPWTARKLLWNPEPMGSIFGRICLEAFETEPGNFGRTVMALLERDYGVAPLEEALRAPVMGRAALANAVS
ncbi:MULTISPECIES: photosystem II high light acclimation radical SAM protein [Prochlorococcus]|uniref:photosystem II high light acclimation radical SAM protein n=1 Tax=Prochlorococcus TaxID=1218 RepID=UPI0007B382BF|nr:MULTISPECIES: photosystem II high light acclimation radical SAM protein [Prochlorococcus]KZR63681.1 Ribosomal protein S12 methylthiotransferase RimO [Prochlorococcus marinus str. MIT 1312]KZR78835.1 Ribosomal protein S12 methylthiotransferase RimO [Prochlorococcus marinus str. MIT 1327]NMO84511.1 B12-binding domain-containing radical SAM protein [Prochlorococcus sp. P1344]NMP06181.1 B12-binding domain-containing radical SAM protein [Prochlorococcus sp. P1361]NMP14182.1 B12-binding domain-co